MPDNMCQQNPAEHCAKLTDTGQAKSDATGKPGGNYDANQIPEGGLFEVIDSTAFGEWQKPAICPE